MTKQKQKQIRIYSIVIIAFAFILYANTLGHDFAWDDKIVITENARVQEGISGISDLFNRYMSDTRADKYGYRPITLISFAIDYSLFGMEPGGYHFMSILYFAVLCVVIFLFLRRLFENISPLVFFLVTLLFAAHPIHVEAVANIKSRDEILAMLFGLLTVVHILQFYRNSKWKHILFGTLFYVLAFLSRENAMTYIAVIPLAIIIQGKIQWKPFLKSIVVLPLFAVFTWFVLQYSLLSELGKEQTEGFGAINESNILGNGFLATTHFGDRIANAFHLITLYWKKFIIPYPLTYYSGYNQIPIIRTGWQVITGFIILIGLVATAVVRLRKNPLMVFGGLFFLITISIYLQFVMPLADAYADRFLFAPSLGIILFLSGIVIQLTKPIKDKVSDISFKGLPTIAKVIFIIIALSLSSMTIIRNGAWKDNYTLVLTDMPHLENCARAHYYFATETNIKMSKEGWSSDLEKSMIDHYTRSIEISDSIYYARIELAGYYLNNERYSEGIPVLIEATQVFPHASDPHYYLGQTYVQTDRYEESIPMLERSIELAPRSHDSYYLLIIAYGKTEAFDEGIELGLKGIEKFPEQRAKMHEALGYLYFDHKNLVESTKNTLKSIEFGANPYNAYATVIGRYQTVGDDSNASKYYQEAIAKGIMQPGVQ